MPVKWTDLKKWTKILAKYNFSKLNQEVTENMNRSITSTEIKSAIKNFFQQTKAQDQMASQANSTMA